MITNENIIMIACLGITALIAFFLLVLFYSRRRVFGKMDQATGEVDEDLNAHARPTGLNPDQLLTYWRKVKETIHVFDDIIVRYVVQWSAVLLGMIGASVVVLPTSNLVAGAISLGALVVSFPIAINLYFYYELLEEALRIGIDVEKLIFKDEELASELGLTCRLFAVSAREYGGITFFGWTMFLIVGSFAAISLILSLVYFFIC